MGTILIRKIGSSREYIHLLGAIPPSPQRIVNLSAIIHRGYFFRLLLVRAFLRIHRLYKDWPESLHLIYSIVSTVAIACDVCTPKTPLTQYTALLLVFLRSRIL